MLLLVAMVVLAGTTRCLGAHPPVGPAAASAAAAAAAAAAGGGAGAGAEGASWQPLNITEKTDEQVLASYLARFKVKRAQQWQTTEEILEKPEYEHRYRLSQALVDEMFRSLRKAQRTLAGVNLSALPPVPLGNETLLGAAVATWENTAFLSDLVLRLPDMLHLQIDGHAVRTDVLRWALATCLASPVFRDASFSTPLRLAQQELALVERDPDYVNPYRGVDNVRPTTQAPPRTRLARGPRLQSRGEL